MQFETHPTLRADTVHLGSLPLCEVLLMNDTRFPWIILVPKIPNLRDFHELPHANRDDLFQEIEKVSTVIQKLWSVDKMNIAALGNQVPQLHIHVIGRRTTDEAWPNPVWGIGSPCPYDSTSLSEVIKSLHQELVL